MIEENNPQGFTAEESAALEAMKADAPLNTPSEPAVEPSEPASQPDPTPAAAEPPPAAEGPEKPPQGFVPHGAMHAEREAKRAAESEAAQLRAELAAMRLAQQQAQQPQEPDTPPDMFAEPEKYNDWVQRQNAASQQQIQQMQQQMQQQLEMQQLTAALQGDAVAFALEKPDYSSAEAHLVQTRTSELQMIYPRAQPAEIAQAVERERLALVQQAQQSGMRPAEFIYNLATHRGYAAPALQPAPQTTQVAAQMQAQAQAAAATQSLASAPANAGAGDLTMEGISKMSSAEYAKLKAERPDDVLRVMRGA